MRTETTEATSFVSPFSYTNHTWSLIWKRMPSNEKYDKPFETDSVKEQKALEAIASVGVIGGVQLRTLFNLDKKRVNRMVARKMLICHEIKQSEKSIPIYTIGKTGANKVMPKYIDNYWIEMNAEDVLKRLVFFQLCFSFKDNLKIKPSPSPFVGTLQLNNNDFYIYVSRGSVEDLMMYLKWKSFSDRIIIVTENMNHLKPIEVFIQSKNLKVRAVTDEGLKQDKPTFFHLKENKEKGICEWIS